MSVPPSPDQLRATLLADYHHPFEGWNFAHLAGRRVMIFPADTWDYTATVSAAIHTATRMLDMGTGGGEFMAGLPVRPPTTVATESYAPNVPPAQRRLQPLGVEVVAVSEGAALPFPDASFDLVINRHSAYAPPELHRILVPGGRFITQQVGSQTNRELHQWLGDATPAGTWTLDRAGSDLEAAGLEVLEQREEYPIARFFDVGAVVYYLKAIAWEIPDFSVDRYFEQLAALDRRIRQDGHVDVTFHHFFLLSRRP